MENKQKLGILLFGALFGAILTSGVWYYVNHEHTTQQASKTAVVQSTNTKTKELQKIIDRLEKENSQLKKGTSETPLLDLDNSATQLFQLYYNYDQSKTTNKERQRKGVALADSPVLEQLFPLSADGMKSDFGFIKSQMNDCQIYVAAQNGAQYEALAVVNYTTQAGSLEPSGMRYVWKVKYDGDKKLITEATEMGKLSTGLNSSE